MFCAVSDKFLFVLAPMDISMRTSGIFVLSKKSMLKKPTNIISPIAKKTASIISINPHGQP
jgi:hypothetical protein